jgi:hypothetical protein
MKRSRVITIASIGILHLCAFIAPACHAQSRVIIVEPKYLKGKVENVDFVAGTVTVKWVQDNGDNDEMAFKVNFHTMINRGDTRLSIFQLNKGDLVVVQYVDDPTSFGPLKAETISVNPGNS